MIIHIGEQTMRPVFVLLLVVGVTASPVKDQCAQLKKIRNAEYKGDGRIFSVGDKVEVQCRPGYKQITPSLQAWCTKEKRWTLLGECKSILCHTPKDPENGIMIYEGNTPGSKVTISCYGGYRYTGSKHRTCRKDGTWSGTSGACEEIICPPPPDLIYGGYRQGGPYKYGAELTVECDEDVILVGSKTRTCLEDSRWSGKEANCTAVEDISCPPPQQDHLQPCPVGRYNDTIEVRCVDGYRYSGTVYRQCQGDGTWSGGEGTCQDVYCKVPDDTDYNVVEHECGQNCKYGTNVTVACRAPYSYNNTAHDHTCGADGQWHPQIAACIDLVRTGEVKDSLRESWSFWFVLILGIIVITALIIALIYSAVSGSRPFRFDKCGHKLSAFRHQLATGHSTSSEISMEVLQPAYTRNENFMKRRLIFHKNNNPVTNFKVKEVILNKNNCITYIEGRDGVGKTTFVKNLLKNHRKWTEADNHFEATLLVDLHYVFRSGSTETSLRHFLLDRRQPGLSLTKQQIDKSGKGTLVILDGLDAFRQSMENDLVEKIDKEGTQNWSELVAQPSEWIILILQRKVLMEAVVVVTSRKMSELNLVQDLKHNSIEILTPREEDIMKFVSKHHGQHIQDILSSNNFLLSACVQPDVCKLICQVLKDVTSETNQHRNQNQHHQIDLGEVVTHTRLMDFVTRPPRTPNDQGDPNEHQSLINDQTIPALQPLSHLAYITLFGHGIKENIQEFGKDELTQAEITEEIESELQNRGLLIPTHTCPVRNGNVFCIRRQNVNEKLQKFPHPTYQEYLAIAWLAAGQEDANTTRNHLTSGLYNPRFLLAPFYVNGLCYDSYCSSLRDQLPKGKTSIENNINTIQLAYDITDHLLLVQAAHETQKEEKARELLRDKFQNEKILIKESYVSAFAVKSIEYVLSLRLGLTSLSLEGVDMDEGSWKQLRDFLCLNTTLKELSLDHTYLWEKSLEYLKAGLSANTGITHLSLRDTGIDDRGILYIVTTIMENNYIAVLSLHENPVSRKEILNFKRYLQGAHREILRVEEEKMREDGVAQ